MNKEFYRKLLALVLPIAFQQLMLALVGASDAVMLGALSQDALSSVSLAGQVTFVFNLFLTALAMGASMLASQYWGERNATAIEKILALTLRASLLISLIFSFSTLTLPGQLMRLLTSERALIDRGSVYLQASSLSYLLCGISQIYLCILKNTGHAVKSMCISSAAVLLNIFLNAVLIFGWFGMPALGITGAAAATVIARAVETAWTILDSRKTGRIRLNIRHFLHADKALSNLFWKHTLPVLGNQLAWGCGFTMYSVIMGHLGSDAVAANSIANVVKNLLICFCSGIANGGSILVGNALGAGTLALAKDYGKKLCQMAVFSGVLSGLALLFTSPLIIHFTNLSGQSETYLKWMLAISSYYIAGKSVNMTTIGGIFTAGGDTRFGLVCDTVTLWCVTVPLGAVAAFALRWPVPAVYFVLNLDEIVKLPVVYLHYKSLKWVRNLTKQRLGMAH